LDAVETGKCFSIDLSYCELKKQLIQLPEYAIAKSPTVRVMNRFTLLE